MLELLLRNEPTRHALLGFENEPFAILVIRGVRLPRLMMPLFALPFDVAAVDGNEDLEFTALVLVPPTEFDAHAFPRKDELPSAFGERKFSDNGIGAKIENGKAGFKELEAYILEKGDIDPNESGRQEFLENLINEFI